MPRKLIVTTRKRITDPRRHARDVEQGVDRTAEPRRRPGRSMLRSDRSSLVKLLERQRGSVQVKSDDLGAELGELPGEVVTDARCRSR